MAHLSFEQYMMYRSEFDHAHSYLGSCNIDQMPVLWTSAGHIWEEGSAYLAFRAKEVAEGSLSITTVHGIAWHLLAFLKFCEQSRINPMEFGPVRHEKPTYLFRAHLIDKNKKQGEKRLRTSTSAARINAIAQFFSWTLDHGFLSEAAVPFRRKRRHIAYQGQVGAPSTLRVDSTDLSIQVSRKEDRGVEGGLMPVSLSVRDQILQCAYEGTNTEFALMLDIGFRTGIRLQTICSLTERTLETAHKSESGVGHYLLVGPQHGVATKFSVNYRAWIPDDLLDRLREYACSPRRMIRQQEAILEHRSTLLLSRWATPYIQQNGERSAMVSQELSRLRQRIPHIHLKNFYFHCTRATFGTSIVIAGLKAGISVDKIVNRVRQLLGHKYAETSLRYIAFVEEMETQQAIDEELGALYAK